jgi:hypothetical protein
VWRFLIRIDAQVLQAVLTGWLRHRLPAQPAVGGREGRVVIAVDGKVLRGAKLPDGRQVHLLSAYDTVSGIVPSQLAITAKSNEIPAFTPLLEQVQAQLGSLSGTIIVADALHAPGRPRPRRGRPRRAADGPGQGQPTHPVCPAQAATMGAGAGRAPNRDRGHGRREPAPSRR